MRVWIKKINQAILLGVLTIIYFPLVGMTYLLFRLSGPKKKIGDTHWIEPDDKTADFKSPY